MLRIVAAFLTVACCFTATEAAAIQRPVRAVEGEFPYVVSITRNMEHVCSGFIYNDRWIVTVASCVIGVSSDRFEVVVGQLTMTRINAGEDVYPVKHIYIRQDYNSTTHLHDLALLQVGRPIKFGPYAKCLARDLMKDSTASPALMVGWGASNEGGPQSIHMRKLSMTLPADCYVYGKSYDPSFMICAGTEVDQGGPCNYDEGSPLVRDGNVVGIMSYQRGCGKDPFYASVFTRIALYRFWFEEIAGDQPPCAP